MRRSTAEEKQHCSFVSMSNQQLLFMYRDKMIKAFFLREFMNLVPQIFLVRSSGRTTAGQQDENISSEVSENHRKIHICTCQRLHTMMTVISRSCDMLLSGLSQQVEGSMVQLQT